MPRAASRLSAKFCQSRANPDGNLAPKSNTPGYVSKREKEWGWREWIGWKRQIDNGYGCKFALLDIFPAWLVFFFVRYKFCFSSSASPVSVFLFISLFLYGLFCPACGTLHFVAFLALALTLDLLPVALPISRCHVLFACPVLLGHLAAVALSWLFWTFRCMMLVDARRSSRCCSPAWCCGAWLFPILSPMSCLVSSVCLPSSSLDCDC